jgi:glucose-6-phosphate isomerase
MASLWEKFQKYFLQYDDLGFAIDISRMNFADALFEKMRPQIDHAFRAMVELEGGEIANPDEQRMVGHYWLRAPVLAPNEQLRRDIEATNARIKKFAADVHRGKITAPGGEKFQHIVLIGIGGSALGPQFIADALGNAGDPTDIFFFDNTDPDGFDRNFEKIGSGLAQTLVVVISKSGGTKETRNGMLEAQARFRNAGLETRRRRHGGRERVGQICGTTRLARSFSDA